VHHGITMARTPTLLTSTGSGGHGLAQRGCLYTDRGAGKEAFGRRVLTRQTPYSFPLPTTGTELVYGRP
jgi:hypothetical protein